MTKPVIILGGGGHAKVLIDTLHIAKTNIIGICEFDEERKGEIVSGIKVVGNDDFVLRHSVDDVVLVNGLGSSGKITPRRNLFVKFKELGYGFLSVIHPSVIIASGVRLGEGVQIMAGVIVQPGTTIGENTIVNTKASIDHDCKISSHVHIAPGSTIAGDVCVMEGVHIGVGSTVIQGVKIGENSIVGAGSVVIQDIPSGKVVYGVPACNFLNEGDAK